MTGLTHRSDRTIGPRPRRRRDDRVTALILLAPALLGFGLFYVYPTFRGIWYSLSDFTMLNTPSFIGGANYDKLIHDPQVWHSLWVTALFAALNVGGQIGIGLGLAALMHRLTRSTAIRSVLLLPWLVPNVAVALIWAWLLDANLGFVTHALSALGLTGFGFYNPSTALLIVAVINIWSGVGYTSLLLYAGMLEVPSELYESAALDGAGEARIFTRITLPILRPILALVMVVSLIGSFQLFDTVQIGYAGRPIPAVRVIYYYIYQQAFGFFKMGYASAIAMVLGLILAVLTLVQLRIMRASSSDLA